MDVDSQKWIEYAGSTAGLRSRFYRVEGRRLRQEERALTGWARAVTLVSEAEADLYRRISGGGEARVVPLGVDLEGYRPGEGRDGRGCVFVGALDYSPNVDGAAWFCREVWPDVLRRHPGATISLVGRRPVPEILRLARLPGVEVVGQVPDVRPYLERAAVVVAPLRIARGVQCKVLEAMAMGKAIVASPPALAGLDAEPGMHLVAASSPYEWSRRVSDLLADPDLRQRLGAAGRRFVEDRHRWEDCLKPLADLLGLAPSLPDPERVSASLAV
jgi:polysaccharide biosynthesis protein PslH